MAEANNMKEMQGFVKEFTQVINEGYTMADLANISPEQLECLYSLGYQNYVTDNYKNAAEIFKLLSSLDPLNSKYFMGLASCQQCMHEYEKASETYSAASVLTGLEDPEPMYHASVCLLKAGRKDDAIVALESIDAMGREGNVSDLKFKMQAANLLKVLKGN